MVTAKLICVFVLAYADCWFSHEVAHLITSFLVFQYICRLGFEHRKPVYINIVRNPLDRLLSYYYFVRYGDNFRPYLRRKKWADKQVVKEPVLQILFSYFEAKMIEPVMVLF